VCRAVSFWPGDGCGSEIDRTAPLATSGPVETALGVARRSWTPGAVAARASGMLRKKSCAASPM
jgi:hypothetical protein